MPHEISFVDNTGGTLAHYKMLERIKLLAEANGWTVLRYDAVSANRELILKGLGLPGTEEVFVGFRTYQDSGADYYNLVAATFIGYVDGNTFDTQPGVALSGVPAHNSRIDYWLTLNGQRIVLAMKVGTPVYEMAYVGKFLPRALPTQYPAPLICAGMLTGTPATRFSDTTHSMPFKGNRANFKMRDPGGAWINAYTWPFQNTDMMSLRDTNGSYPLTPIVLDDNVGNIYGELDGVFHISGFNNAVENTISLGGKTYVVIQDVSRTGFGDYVAMRMDT